MSHSEDEDDFLSADEDVDCQQESRCDITTTNQQDGTKLATNTNESSDIKVIHAIPNAKDIESIPDIKLDFDEVVAPADSPIRKRTGKTKSEEKRPSRPANEEATSDDDDRHARQEEDEDEVEVEDEDDDEEAALAERIRERNLKIARNFSVEIVKNLQASAPIPVEVSASSPRRQRYSDNSTDLNGSSNPPAPPPTPALSSSYNNQEEQFNKNTSGSSPSLSTQYSWRLTSKATANKISSDSASTDTLDTLKSTGEAKDCLNTAESSAKSSEARLALDRLSQKLSQPDKNLFERVAADIRNMSITGDDSIIAADVTSQLNSLPSTITDIGSTLGGWGWSGATRLLSSATQVTSQVGSVLNSIVDVAQDQAPKDSALDTPDRQEDHVAGTRGAKSFKSD